MGLYNTELFNLLFSDNGYIRYPSVENKVLLVRENFFFEGKPINEERWNKENSLDNNKIFLTSKPTSTLVFSKSTKIQPKVILPAVSGVPSSFFSRKRNEGEQINYKKIDSLTDNVRIQLQPITKTLYVNGKNILYRMNNNTNKLNTYISFDLITPDGFSPLMYNTLTISNTESPLIEGNDFTITGPISINFLKIAQNVKLNVNSKVWVDTIVDNPDVNSVIKIQPSANNETKSGSLLRLSKFDFNLAENNSYKLKSFKNECISLNRLFLNDTENIVHSNKILVEKLYLFNLNYSGNNLDELFLTQKVYGDKILLVAQNKSDEEYLYKLEYNNINSGKYVIHSKKTNELTAVDNDDLIGNLIEGGYTVDFHEVDENNNYQLNDCFKFWKDEETHTVHIYGNTLIEED